MKRWQGVTMLEERQGVHDEGKSAVVAVITRRRRSQPHRISI